MLNTYIKDGYFQSFKDKLKKTTMFSLMDWLKKALTYFNVIHTDPCCDSGIYSPMRYNSNTNTIESFNQTTNAWDAAIFEGEYIPTYAEDRIVILDKTPEGIIEYPKGTIIVGYKLFIVGTKKVGVTSIPIFIYYPDVNDLSVYESVILPFQAYSVCYDSNTNKIYAPLCSTSSTTSQDLLIIDVNDPINFTTVTLSGLVFASRASIITDGTYLYTSNVELHGVFAKIRISDFHIMNIRSWIGSWGTIASVISDDLLYGYFMSETSNKLAKLNLNTMTYTEVSYASSCTLITDDIAYLPTANTGIPNYVIGGSSVRNGTSNKGGIAINVDDMTTIYQLDFMPSSGVIYDSVNEKFYNLGLAGFIEVIKIPDLIDYLSGTISDSRTIISTYSMRGYAPMELIPIINGLTIVMTALTHNNNNIISNDINGNVLSIAPIEGITPTLLSKQEHSYRWSY